MAEMFLGMRMTVVLRSGHTVTGFVAQIVPNELLVLQQAYASTGEYFETMNVHPGNIQDIVDTRSMLRLGPTPPAAFTAPPATSVTASALPESSHGFQDPAILSMGKRPDLSRSDERRNVQPPNIGEKRDPPPAADTPVSSDPVSRLEAALRDMGGMKIVPPTPEQSTALDTTEDDLPEATPTAPSAQATKAGKKARRRKPKGKAPRIDDGEATPTSVRSIEQGPGSGWRQTPILQSSTNSFQPFASLKKSQKQKQKLNADNGWASEDVTDVQEAGDFDFEGNLTKFDKRTIFDEMRQKDHIDESERLVSHNRLPRPKPGTAGGKNLHYTENVLDLPSTSGSPANLGPKLKETLDDFWKSEADDATINGGERLSGREGSGRSSRLRGESRVSTTRRSQSRKASASQNTIVGGPSRVNSNQPSFTNGAEGFYTVPSDRRIETVTHLQMLNLENIAHNEIGLSEDLMAENAGRSISEVALITLSDPAMVLRNAAASPPVTPTIVVLAGNNKSSVRAISAGRHLRNRGINVLVCVVGIEREKDLIEEVQKQVRLFRNFGGTVCSKTQLFKHLSKTAMTLNSSSQVSITLIIDALLGLSISFEELRKSHQAATYELMEWANRNEAFVMAIDIPSGVDPTNGKVNIIDGDKLYVHPRYVVALGAPKQGLLKAMEIGHEDLGDIAVDDWKLYLADIGFGATIWRKAATNVKLRRGIDFDDKWVLELRYQPHECDS